MVHGGFTPKPQTRALPWIHQGPLALGTLDVVRVQGRHGPGGGQRGQRPLVLFFTLAGMSTASVPTNTGLFGRLAAGYGAQVSNVVVSSALQILLVPLFLSGWGKTVYGDWLMLSAIAGFVGLADLGVGGVLANRLRAAWSRGQAAAFQRTLATGVAVYGGLVGFWAVVLPVVALALDLPTRLGLAAGDDAPTIFLWLACANLLMVPRTLATAIYSARGEFGREGLLNLVYYCGQSLLVGVSVVCGAGPVNAAAVYFAAGLALGWGPLLVDVANRHRDVRLMAVVPTRTELAELAAKAPFYLVPAGAWIVLLQLPVVILGLLSTPETVVAFTTMRTFTGLTRQVTIQFFAITAVEMARQYTQGDTEGLLRLYRDSGRMIGAITGLLAGFSLVAGPSFFVLWTRGAVAFDPLLAEVFLATTLLLLPSFGSTGLLRLTDHPRAAAASFVLQPLCAAVVSALLVALGLGPVGAGLGVGVAELVAPGAWSMMGVSRLLGLRVGAFIWPILSTAALALALGSGAALAVVRLIPGGRALDLAVIAVLWLVLVVLPTSFLLLDARQRAAFRVGLGRWWQRWRGSRLR